MDIREEIYEEITKFPLPDHIVTYRPYIPNRNEYRRSRRTTFDDLIYLNLKELVPNVYLGLHTKHTTEDTKKWVQLTKSYGDILNEQLQSYCDRKLKQIQQIEENTQRTHKFDYSKVQELPLDIQEQIQSYLMPETRLTILEEKYKNIKENMKKWKVEHLKTFLSKVICDIYEPKSYEDYMLKCLPERITIYKSCTNKKQYIDEIFKLYELFKKAVPKSYEKYQYFWNTALKLFMSIMYVHKRVVKTETTTNVETAAKTEKKKKKIKIVNKK
tara:strand:- start:119 stop:934 length:816 start_codon:yes stop_codon:yes gene_type:complete